MLSKIFGKTREVQKQVVKQMLTHATSGFGLVAALAWNEFMKLPRAYARGIFSPCFAKYRLVPGFVGSEIPPKPSLTWRRGIKNLIDSYIKPLVGRSSVIVSQLIYAVIVTVLAVFITYQLATVLRRLG